MTSESITAILCAILLVIGQVASAPTDDSVKISSSNDADSARQDPLDYVKQVNSYNPADAVQLRSVTSDSEGLDMLAEADREYEQLLRHVDDDYEYYSSTEDEDSDSDSDQKEKDSILRSGNLVLTSSGFSGSGQRSQSTGLLANQQKQGISQVLNSAYYSSQGQSNFPATQNREVITQTLNPAYATTANNKMSLGKANAAKLLYLIGLLSNSRPSSSGTIVGSGQSSQSQSVLSGTSGGRLTYGQTVIRQPATSNMYGNLGVLNTASSGTSSSGSNYDFSSNNGRPIALSTGASYDTSRLGGQAFIQLIKPIARLVAIQTTSPQKSWSTFLENINQAQISGSSAYQTLYKQINYESKRQQSILNLLKRYRQIASNRVLCNRT